MSDNTQPDHKARKHHPYGPSSLGSLERSPCFRSRSGDNEASRLGTAQHEAVESGEISDELSDEKADAVARALSMTTQLVELLESKGRRVVVFAEQYLRIDDEPNEDWTGTTGGFPDWVALYETDTPGEWYAYVLDWKFGQYAVTRAKDNRQGQAYLIGVAHALSSGELKDGDKPLVGRVVAGTVVFFSPHRDEEPSQHEFSVADLERLYPELVSIVTNAAATRALIKRYAPAPPPLELFKTSPSTCSFCANLADCPAVRALAEKIRARYAPLDVPADIVGATITDADAAAAGLKVASTVATWAKAYRKRLTDAAFENPDKIPTGYRLTASNPVRVLKPKGLYDKLVGIFGIDAVHAHIEVPLTPFDKEVRSKAERGQKDAAEEAFRETLRADGLIEPSDVPVISLRMK